MALETLLINTFLFFLVIDCQWSEWTKQGACSRQCGPGIQTFVRSKTVHEQNAGYCDQTYTKEEQCNLKECPDESGFTYHFYVFRNNF